ncbi:Alpha/Beta hydrolase protein [Mycena vitilis]|nr:Alpha/Beta hydrolase protein [Mycena vitilis]
MNWATLSSLALLASSVHSTDNDVCSPAETVVKLSYGSFQGTIVGSATQFLGIPFAQPPVGDLRFREPMDPIPFVGLRLADKFGPACPQQTMASIPGLNFTGNYGSISEDCLTISVLKPAPDGHDLPVIVWFHGGGFEIGDSSDTIMNSILERSVRLGKPVVVVVPNYRVNAFGFLAGKEVKAAGVGNLGLRDQQFALEWVQQHITAFGGNPNHVIMFVHLHSDRHTVGMHLVASYAEHTSLFHGAFMESGAAASMPHITEGQPQYDHLVVATNCTDATDSLDCLRHAPFDTLMLAINQTPNIFSYSSLGNVWKPRVDGDFLKQDPFIALSRGLHAKVPIIAGDCDDEGTLFSLSNMNITTDQEFLDYMHSNYLPRASKADIMALGVMYPSDHASGSPFGTGLSNAVTPEFKRLAAVQGDIIFHGPRRNLLSKVSTAQNAWGYLYERGKSVPLLGSSHCADLQVWLARNTTDFFGIDTFIQFITALDPNIPANGELNAIAWPKWNTLDHGALLSFSDPSSMGIITDNFREEPIAFLNRVQLQLAQSSA